MPAADYGGTVRYAADTDPARLDHDWIQRMLAREVYWARWRTPADIEAQLAASWRVVGVYEEGGAQVGFARAVSDGVAFAYLADVVIDPAHRGHGLGKLLVQTMIDDGPGADFRWTLFTSDAHGLYEQYGFQTPDATAMVRPSRQ